MAAFGTKLVIFADSGGQLHVLDAYCRHMDLILVEGANCREVVDNVVDMAHFFYVHFAFPTFFKTSSRGTLIVVPVDPIEADVVGVERTDGARRSSGGWSA